MKRLPTVLLSLALAAACLLGGCAPQGERPLDLSSSAWLDACLEETLPAYGKDFTQSAAFSYREEGGGKLVLLYASKAGVTETRDYYLTNHGAVQSGRNDDTALALTIPLDQGTAQFVNYYSPVSRVFEIETDLTNEAAAPLTEAVQAAFPTEAAEEALAGTEFLSGAAAGGYVRYTYDDLDPYYQKGRPIFSRAFAWSGSQEDFSGGITLLRGRYPQYSHDETQDVHYFGTEGGTLALTLLPGAGEGRRVAVSLQAAEATK